MRFWKIFASTQAKNNETKKESKENLDNASRQMYEKILRASREEVTAFTSHIKENEAYLCAYSTDKTAEDIIRLIREELPAFSTATYQYEEITCEEFRERLGNSRYLRYQETEKIEKKTGTNHLFNRRGASFAFREEFTQEETQKFVFSDSLEAEIKRIAESGSIPKFYGHPVHYFVSGNNKCFRRDVLQNLLAALYSAHRLQHNRRATVDMDSLRFKDREDFSEELDALFRVYDGGTVVFDVSYDSDPDALDDLQDQLEVAYRIAQQYGSRVLTVFLLPDNTEKFAAVLQEGMPELRFVRIKENSLHEAQAKEYFKKLAKTDAIRTDKALFASVQPGESYFENELRTRYTKWYHEKICRLYYPQYGTFLTEKVVYRANQPKGKAYDELMQMIGLQEAKTVINNALDFYQCQTLFEQKGLKSTCPAMHMTFTGSPGTAKTTVARLFAKILKDRDVLSTGAFVEVGRADLIGQFVGHTAPKVKRAFEKAEGGVLFIDEAYSLVDGTEGYYGDEAINTIVQEMENNRENIIVIFAGYAAPMEEFINRNPGLRSRIAFHVPFADYTPAELYAIAELMAEKKGLTFSDDVGAALLPIMAQGREIEDFGNGRFVRNVLERAQMKQASRLMHTDMAMITQSQMTTLKGEDFEMPMLTHPEKEQKRAIGF